VLKHFGSTVPGKNVALSQAHFGSTVPGKTSPRVKRILEVLFPEKNRQTPNTARSSAGPILPFFIFIFPGIVLPFFRGQYFHFVIFP
jgi:hypothetical protein